MLSRMEEDPTVCDHYCDQAHLGEKKLCGKYEGECVKSSELGFCFTCEGKNLKICLTSLVVMH